METLRMVFHRYHACTALVLMAIFTVALTWPLCLRANSVMAGPPVDNFEHLYEVWWLKHSLFVGHRSPFFNPDLFYPFGYQVLWARNSSILNTALTIPLSLLGNDVLAYNVLALASFVLSGMGAYLLALRVTGSRLAGLVGGVIFAFCPYRMFRLNVGHAPLLHTEWLPYVLLYTDKVLETPRRRTAMLGGLFFALNLLSSLHYGIISTLVLLPYALYRAGGPSHRENRSRYGEILVIYVLTVAAVAGTLLYPVARLYASGAVALSPTQSTWISASVSDFLVPSLFQPLWGRLLLPYFQRNSHENFVSLGYVALALSVAAVWPSRPRSARRYGLLALSSLILALGPVLQTHGAALYLPVPHRIARSFNLVMTFLGKRLALFPDSFYWRLASDSAIYVPLPGLLLYLFVPFYGFMRYPSRFAVTAEMAVAVLAGLGVARIIRWSNSERRRLVLTFGALAMVLFEFAATPPPFGLSEVRAQPTDLWLSDQPGDFAIMEYPLQRALSGPRLYATSVHGKRITFGYGSLFPSAFVGVLGILEGFPGGASLDLLRSWDVRYILVAQDAYGDQWEGMADELASCADLQRVTSIREDNLALGDSLLGEIAEYKAWFRASTVHIYRLLTPDYPSDIASTSVIS